MGLETLITKTQASINQAQEYLEQLKKELEKSKEKTPFEKMVLSNRKIRYKNDHTINQ